jgi:hypothetical protein
MGRWGVTRRLSGDVWAAGMAPPETRRPARLLWASAVPTAARRRRERRLPQGRSRTPGRHCRRQTRANEKVRDSDSDHVRDRFGRGGDDDDRANARRTVADQCVGDPAEALGRVVMAIRRRVEAERVQITADRFAQQQPKALTTGGPRLADRVASSSGSSWM